MNAGLRLAEKHGVTPEWREEEGQYFATWEEDGVSYSIWLEEERSIREKLNLVSGYSIGGVAFWKLGLEQNEVWNCISDFSMNGSE